MRLNKKGDIKPKTYIHHGPLDAYTLAGKTYYPEGVPRNIGAKYKDPYASKRFLKLREIKPKTYIHHGPLDAYTLAGKTYYPEGVPRNIGAKYRDPYAN